MPAGSSRAVRLDPLALPVRFTASDAGADERVRWVELDRERVVLRRAVRGIPMAIQLPVNAFLGVALRLVATEGGECVTLSLEHRDPALSVPLFSQADGNDVIADWQLWARTLGLPLLVADRGGKLREPFERIGGVRLEPVPTGAASFANRSSASAVCGSNRCVRAGAGAMPSSRADPRFCCVGPWLRPRGSCRCIAASAR